MEIAKPMAGFSRAEADDLRKAIGKKKRDLMATMKDKFMEGLDESGHRSPRSPSDIWTLNEAAADYSFNKSHAACYGLIAYRTAYLKANYPAEYMAAVISSVMNTKDKVPFFVNRCEEMGIDVLPPDVNSSDHDFVVSEKAIRFGLDAVKNVGHTRGRGDPARPRGRPDRLDLGLLRAGRLARGQQTGDRMPDQVRRARLDRGDPQGDAGGAAGGPVGRAESAGGRAARPGLDLRLRRRGGERGRGGASSSHHRPPISAAEFERRELLAMEKETLGTYLSSHPLSEVREALRARVDCSLAELASKPDGAWVTVGGIVAESKKIRTKSGNQMMFATLDDVEGQVEMLVFKADQAESAGAIETDAVVLVRGRIDHKERGETKLVVQEAERFEPDVRGDGPGERRRERAGEPLRLDDRRDEPRRIPPDRRAEGGVRSATRAMPRSYLAIADGDGGTREIGSSATSFRVAPPASRLTRRAWSRGSRRRRSGCLDFCCARYAPEDR